jgi:hypothetical protein
VTEEQERRIYEWLRPELEGKDWFIALRHGDPVGVWGYNTELSTYAGKVPLPDLDYNTFMGEAALKLDTEGIWLSLSAGMWRLDESDDDLRWHLVSQDTDPWVMLVKYLQGK